MAFSVIVYNITWVSFRQQLCTPAPLGPVNATVHVPVWGAQPAGALAGPAGSAIDTIPALWVGTTGTVPAALPVLFSPLTRMRTLPDGYGPPQ